MAVMLLSPTTDLNLVLRLSNLTYQKKELKIKGYKSDASKYKEAELLVNSV